MGVGDELMATAQAKVLHEKNGIPVLIIDRHECPRWHEIWHGNPRLVSTAASRHQRLMNAGGVRPYIALKTRTHWTWRRWDIQPGEIYLTDEEREFARPYSGRIFIEPHTKIPTSNKAWIWERWQEVAARFPGSFIQTGQPGTRWLNGVESVITTFREACAIMQVSKAYLGPEGAGHHAAAALGVPAVVLWSEFIAPEFTGYASQRNLRHAGPACGARVPCGGCKASMDLITVDEVITELEQIAC